MNRLLRGLAIGLMMSTAPMAWAQTDTTATATASEIEIADLLTQAELENLVAPVALYPDALLIQLLVAATYPLQIIKADRFVQDNADLEQDAFQAAIDSQQYDESVAVLATAFPNVLADMAEHIDWTDTIGTAMLAQRDDILAAVQTMRSQAINAGALISGAEQTVSVDDGAVIIQPTNPKVVYVPQYDTRTVYVKEKTNTALVNTLILFGSVALIDNIFDKHNHWHGYWRCRNCGGWNGKPIYRNPRVRISKGGNVNIDINVNIGGGWKPDPRRQREARKKIGNKRRPGGVKILPTNRPDARGDQLRSQLSNRIGDGSSSRNRGNLPRANRAPTRRPSIQPGGTNRNAITRPGQNPTRRPSVQPGGTNRNAITRPSQNPTRARPSVRKPSARPTISKPAARVPSIRQPSVMQQRAPAQRVRAASSRGKPSGGNGGKRVRR